MKDFGKGMLRCAWEFVSYIPKMIIGAVFKC